MTVVSRRLVPFAAVLAVAVTLAVWITAGAASPRSATMLPTMHFHVVPISGHSSQNGATQKNPAGASYQEAFKLVSDGKMIGSGFIVGTFVNKAGAAFQNISVVFPGRGRIELQGVAPPSGNSPSVITGGTGIFAGASGKAVSHNKNVTVTFS